MNQNATITSKMQFTIPINIARKIGVKSGERVNVSEENGRIIIAPVKNLLAELAGSLSLPDRWKGKNIDSIIRESKQRHFKSKNI